MKRFLILFAALFLSHSTFAAEGERKYPEARPFAQAPGAKTEIKAAFARAKVADKRVMLVFGLDACHDSRGLAGWFATPRFAAMLQAKYEIVWIDVGRDLRRNRNLAKRFGVAPIVGTPTVLVLDKHGTALNTAEAGGWRNAASRSEDDIFAAFEKLGA